MIIFKISIWLVTYNKINNKIKKVKISQSTSLVTGRVMLITKKYVV